VQHYKRLAAQDIRFDVPLADACYDDRKTLCAAVPPVSLGRASLLRSGRELSLAAGPGVAGRRLRSRGSLHLGLQVCQARPAARNAYLLL
jgi:hypothetical protein